MNLFKNSIFKMSIFNRSASKTHPSRFLSISLWILAYSLVFIVMIYYNIEFNEFALIWLGIMSWVIVDIMFVTFIGKIVYLLSGKEIPLWVCALLMLVFPILLIWLVKLSISCGWIDIRPLLVRWILPPDVDANIRGYNAALVDWPRLENELVAAAAKAFSHNLIMGVYNYNVRLSDAMKFGRFNIHAVASFMYRSNQAGFGGDPVISSLNGGNSVIYMICRNNYINQGTVQMLRWTLADRGPGL